MTTIDENISINDIRAAKEEAESKVLKAILEFSRFSGTPVEEIEFNYILKRTKCGTVVDFKIELSVKI